MYIVRCNLGCRWVMLSFSRALLVNSCINNKNWIPFVHFTLFRETNTSWSASVYKVCTGLLSKHMFWHLDWDCFDVWKLFFFVQKEGRIRNPSSRSTAYFSKFLAWCCRISQRHNYSRKHSMQHKNDTFLTSPDGLPYLISSLASPTSDIGRSKSESTCWADWDNLILLVL